MAIVLGDSCRVFMNGVDISSSVRECRINYAVDAIVTTTLTLYDSPRIDEDGIIHLATAPPAVTHGLPVDTDGRPLRAILIRHED